MHIGYSKEVEALIRDHYSGLPEKERRRYAALEAAKLGYGGQSYLKRLLGIDYKTMRLGKKELFQLLTGTLIQ